MMKKCEFLLLCAFFLVWIGGAGLMDFGFSHDFYLQLHANGFVTTTGTVTSSQVRLPPGSKDGYEVDIHYSYTVAAKSVPGGTVPPPPPAVLEVVSGPTRTGENYRYEHLFSAFNRVDAVVKQHPAGSLITVYYDPNQPDDSVLNPGLNGKDLILMMMMTSCNFGALALLYIAHASWPWKRIRRTMAGGVKWWRDGSVLRIRLDFSSPMVFGLSTVGPATLIGSISFGVASGGDPSLAAAGAAWAVVLGLGLAAAGWQWRKQARGLADLVVNEDTGTLELPATSDRKQRETVALADVQGVEVVLVERPYRGRRTKPTIIRHHLVTLRRRNGDGDKLIEWPAQSQDRAREFAAWLRDKLRLPEAGGDLPSERKP